MFKEIFREQVIHCNGVYVVQNSEQDADCFDGEDVAKWKNRYFEKTWTSHYLQKNEIYADLINCVLNENKPVVDIATGPGMGFVPEIKIARPELPCLAIDASDVLIQSWKDFFAEHSNLPTVELGQFSLFDLPFEDESVDVYTSYLGIGSTRKGGTGYDKVLSELFRTLKKGGKLFAVEGEWIDKNAFLELFSKMNREPWNCFVEEPTWVERFEEHGFEIISSKLAENKYFENDDDHELSPIAKSLNIKIGIALKAYILKKPDDLFI